MSSQISMTGLNAAQKDISVTSNNIANSGTVGFHSSRAEFSDVYSSSPYVQPKTQAGYGTQLSSIKSNFSEGQIAGSSSALDMAIQGTGFFIKKTQRTDGETLFTRAGSFQLDSDGFIVDSFGNYLFTFPVAENGTPLSQRIEDMNAVNIPKRSGVPTASSEVDVSFNFSSEAESIGNQDAVPPTNAFDPEDDTSYASTSPLFLLDDAGQPRDAKIYFVKSVEPTAEAQDTSYVPHLVVDGDIFAPVDPEAPVLTFDAFGNQTVGLTPLSFAFGDTNLTFDMSGSSLSRDPFRVLSQSHNGQAEKSLSSLEITDKGIIYAGYDGEEAVALGRIGLADFNNPHGLKKNGMAAYMETNSSGTPLIGAPNESGMGSVRANSLEQSNVDLTSELVNLITAQRNYQANAKALETNNMLTQTILQQG